MEHNRPKRHHFVAESVQRRFCSDKGTLYLFDKRFPGKGVSVTTPKNLYLQTNLYTQYDKQGRKNVEAESKFFSAVDDLGNKLIEQIVERARMGGGPLFSVEQKAAWDLFFYYQWKRVPDMFENNEVIRNFEGEMDAFLAEYEATVRPVTAEERDQFKDPTVIARMKQNTKVRAVVSGLSPEIQGILNRRGLGIAIIRNPRKSFIIGSFPIVKLTYPGRTHLSDSSVEVWFPVSSDVAVTPALSRGEEKLVEINDGKHVRGINEAIFKQSTTIAGRSKELIASLAGVR